jgi:peptide subunit release factor 1 (eRF1)
VSTGVQDVRRLVRHRGSHHVVSLYLDLDPERFATPPARASQIRSLLDEAAKAVEIGDLSHEERAALREDVKRIKSFLSSPDAPFKGARALAVFCSGRDELFETLTLSRPVSGRVMIERAPYVEPMIAAVQERRWLVALVNRSSAWLLAGAPERLAEAERLQENVHGQHDQGGWSQARYERSVEKDVDDHIRHVAELVNQRWRQERFDRLALGGPQEIVPRLEALLSDEAGRCLAPGRVPVDLSSATEASIRAAVEQLVLKDERQREAEIVRRLREDSRAGGRAAAGLADAIEALNERRVQTLVLDPTFDRRAARCPTCDVLLVDADAACPSDGTCLETVEHLREAAVEAALAQDASVVVIRHLAEQAPFAGIGALLRF